MVTKGLSASLPLTKPQAELCVLYLLILSFQISLKCRHTVCLETRAVTHNLPFWFAWPILCKSKAYIMNTGICYVPVSCLDLDLETCFQFMAKEKSWNQEWYADLSEIKKWKKRSPWRSLIIIVFLYILSHNEGVVVCLIIRMSMLSKVQPSSSESLHKT